MRQHTSVSAYVSIRQHTSACVSSVSIRWHTSAYVSIRQHTPAYLASIWRSEMRGGRGIAGPTPRAACASWNTSAYVSIRQHTSAYAYVSIGRLHAPHALPGIRQHKWAYVSIRIRQHRLTPRAACAAWNTSAYVGKRQHTFAYAYVSIGRLHAPHALPGIRGAALLVRPNSAIELLSQFY